MQEHNAKIDSTFLGREDHGITTFSLTLDYGDTAQGCGNIALDQPSETKGGPRVGTALGMQQIIDILDALGVQNWERLPGTTIRVRREDGFHGSIIQIGHIIKDQWADIGVREST